VTVVCITTIQVAATTPVVGPRWSSMVTRTHCQARRVIYRKAAGGLLTREGEIRFVPVKWIRVDFTYEHDSVSETVLVLV
jgi:hypothetical protein